MRINNFDREIENFGIEKEIAHPLWHGLKVVSLPDQKNSLYSTLFTSRAYIPLGEGLYTSSSNKKFVRVWNLYRKSGKSYPNFQADVLKKSHPSIPKETTLAAAFALSKGVGYTDREMVVLRGEGWREVPTDIAVIFPRTTKYLGSGGIGVIHLAQGYLINPDEKIVEKTTFALKEPHDVDGAVLLSRGMQLLKKIWGPGLVRPSAILCVPNGRKGMIIEWAMPLYNSDFRAWAKKHLLEPLQIVNTFITGFEGLKILQDNLVVHCDLKPQNLLVLENGERVEIHINDFDGCFLLPTSLDTESLRTFKEDLVDFFILRTLHYCRTAEFRQLISLLIELKTLLETEEADREEVWLETFSKKLQATSALLKQIQIYEWGWTLITALTDKAPYKFLSRVQTAESNLDLKEPNRENMIEDLASMDEDLRAILLQAIDPDPAIRPGLETFKEGLLNYLERKKIDQKV